MTYISFCEITAANWRAALTLTVRPEQQRFIAACTPIAAIVLAKAYVRPGGLQWIPYAIYAGQTIIGLLAVAYRPDSGDPYWLYHFFIDQHFQGKGYGMTALSQFIALLSVLYPDCRQLNLTVHPENHRARRLYTRLNFHATGQVIDDEPVYARVILAQERRT